MADKVSALLGISPKTFDTRDRQIDDFYATHPKAVKAFVDGGG